MKHAAFASASGDVGATAFACVATAAGEGAHRGHSGVAGLPIAVHRPTDAAVERAAHGHVRRIAAANVPALNKTNEHRRRPKSVTFIGSVPAVVRQRGPRAVDAGQLRDAVQHVVERGVVRPQVGVAAVAGERRAAADTASARAVRLYIGAQPCAVVVAVVLSRVVAAVVVAVVVVAAAAAAAATNARAALQCTVVARQVVADACRHVAAQQAGGQTIAVAVQRVVAAVR